MAVDPAKMTDAAAVRRLMVNAERLERPDIVKACQRRIFELAGENVGDPLEKRLWQMVAAYEEILFQKHGKAQQASYTRRKIKNKGVIATLTDWAKSPKLTPGFEALVANGLAEFTGEYVVIQFADRFPSEVVDAARAKLNLLDVDIKNLPTQK